MPHIPSWQLKSLDRTATLRTVFFASLGLANLVGILTLQVDFLLGFGWRSLPLLSILHFTQVIITERLLLAFIRKPKNWLRLTFLASVGLCLLIMPSYLRLTMSQDADPLPGGAWLPLTVYGVSALLAAFGAALLVTRQYMPLWEENQPPNAAICQDVFECHQNYPTMPEGFPRKLFNICMAALGLVLSCPIWILCLLLIWLEDPGPVFFVKNSVGKGGRNFKQLKLRTMVHNAEARTGPVLSPVFDQRVLVSGRLFRKAALDELPQLVNILKCEMSLVGPRPQRTVLVYEYLKTLPEYAARHRVLPGLAGLAQVAGNYYLTPIQKLRFDNLYIKHMSLGFDLKLLTLAFLIAFWFRWQKNWIGRLPRRMLH